MNYLFTIYSNIHPISSDSTNFCKQKTIAILFISIVKEELCMIY